MKTNAIYFVACDNIVEDQSKKISLINIFDVIYGPQLPINFKFYIALQFFNKELKTITRIEILDPEKNNVGTIGPFTYNDNIGRVNVRIDADITFQSKGIYTFEFYTNDQYRDSLELSVELFKKE